MQESRHHIKARMLKNAARAWGYPETEAENNFDPLVAMLLASCSAELEKISAEVHASRARVLERLVQLLSPDVLTGALPAHGIACATTLEPHGILDGGAQLFTNRKLSSVVEPGSANRDMFFCPTGSVNLNKASIRFMASGTELYSVSNTNNKEVIAHSAGGKELPRATLWLGIDEPGLCLHKTQFYFDVRNEAERNLFIHQLPNASWYLGDRLLNHTGGYGERMISGERLDIDGILNREYDVNGKIRKHINALYKDSFISLLDNDGTTAGAEISEALPDAIAGAFSGKELQLINKQPLRWIAIRFPETISNRLLNDVVCVMNCFPVMNSRLHEINYRLQEIINVIPLHTEDLFLDLAEVSDDEGRMLNTGSGEEDKENSAAMLMRNGGVGRFDERNAASIIDYILQLLRDDTAAFSILGNDVMNSEMKQLQQILNKLEQRLFTQQVHREAIPYLVIRNNEKRQWHNLFIRYWSTNGVDANNIKGGTRLQLYKGCSLNENEAILVTTTRGGRNKLSTTETVLAYKSAMLSKDRLITQEDIKAFCYYQLGDRVQNVEVKKGVMTSPGRQQGYVKTIDVVVWITEREFDQMEENGEVKFWESNLKLLLEERSSALSPYRIHLDKAA